MFTGFFEVGAVAKRGGSGLSLRSKVFRVGEKVEIGFGDVTAEGFQEVFLEVALGFFFTDPDGLGTDSIRAQFLG